MFERIVGDLGDKKKWRAYKARVKALPASYRTAAEGIEKYISSGASGSEPSDGASWVKLFEDLVELFERAAADGTPVRTIVGTTPSEFVDEFVQNYGGAGWRKRAHDRLDKAIHDAEAAEGGGS